MLVQTQERQAEEADRDGGADQEGDKTEGGGRQTRREKRMLEGAPAQVKEASGKRSGVEKATRTAREVLLTENNCTFLIFQ